MDKQFEIAKKIVTKIVDSIEKVGYKFDLEDEEEIVISKSTDYNLLRKELFSTDEEYIIIRDFYGVRLGFIQLIYENGVDVISNHSTNLTTFLKQIEKWIEKEFRK